MGEKKAQKIRSSPALFAVAINFASIRYGVEVLYAPGGFWQSGHLTGAFTRT